MKPRKDFYRVGEILGPPTTIDPTKPNLLGGATPERLSETDYPLYHTRKRCRVCATPFKGMSMSPQYDADPELYGWCGCYRPVSQGYGPWETPKNTPKPYHASTPSRAPRDVLDD